MCKVKNKQTDETSTKSWKAKIEASCTLNEEGVSLKSLRDKKLHNQGQRVGGRNMTPIFLHIAKLPFFLL